MAKVKTSALIAQIRNSIGNTTFSINRYGAVARSKVSPIQPRTTRQLTVRSAFTTNAQGWDALTDTQRATWVAFAAAHPISDVFGDSRILAGNAAYVRANANRAIVGLSAVTTPAATGGLNPGADSNVTGVGSTNVCTVTVATMATGHGWYVVFTTPGLAAGRYFAGSALRIASVTATAASGTTFTFTPSAYNAKLAFIAANVVIARIVRFDINGYVVGTTAYRFVAS